MTPLSKVTINVQTDLFYLNKGRSGLIYLLPYFATENIYHECGLEKTSLGECLSKRQQFDCHNYKI